MNDFFTMGSDPIVFNKAYRNESIDVSFIVPVIDPVDEGDVNRQLGSLQRAIENLAHASNLKCVTEMLAVNTMSDAGRSVLEKYDNVISSPGVNVEKAIRDGARKAKGDYVVVVWQKSTIQESLLKGISIGLNGLPDFMLFDLNCECQDGELFDLSKESQARRAFMMLNTAIPVTSFCISRRFLLSLCDGPDCAGVFSDRIGVCMLFAGKTMWAQPRSVSRLHDSSKEPPLMLSDSDVDSYIKAKFNSWPHREDGSSLFF